MRNKGLVLKCTDRYIILITEDGEYIKVPSRGKKYSPGTEVDLPAYPRRKAILPMAAACIAIALVIFAVVFQFAPVRAVAYVKLDINPSLLLSLDSKGYIIEVEDLNEDAEKIMIELNSNGVMLKGMYVNRAIDVLLDAAISLNYLSKEKKNSVLISLSAPQDYPVTKQNFYDAALDYINRLDMDVEFELKTLDDVMIITKNSIVPENKATILTDITEIDEATKRLDSLADFAAGILETNELKEVLGGTAGLVKEILPESNELTEILCGTAGFVKEILPEPNELTEILGGTAGFVKEILPEPNELTEILGGTAGFVKEILPEPNELTEILDGTAGFVKEILPEKNELTGLLEDPTGLVRDELRRKRTQD